MRAAIFQAVGLPLDIVDLPDPTPNDHDVVLRVGLCGVCGSDLHRTAGHGSPIPPGNRMGHEFSGTVVEVGRKVGRVKLGDRVAVLPMAGCGACSACAAGEFFWCANGFRSMVGGFAEYALADENSVEILPGTLSMADGAVVEPLAAALNGVRLAGPMADARVLVMGAGALGLGSLYWARRFGSAKVAICARSTAQEARALAMGADAFLASGTDLEAQVDDALDGAPDIVIECAGAPGVLRQAMAMVKKRGTVIAMGMCGHEDSYSPAISVNKQIRLQFAAAYAMRDFTASVDALDSGAVEPRAMISRTIPLSMLPETFEQLRNPGPDCKVLVDPHDMTDNSIEMA